MKMYENESFRVKFAALASHLSFFINKNHFRLSGVGIKPILGTILLN